MYMGIIAMKVWLLSRVPELEPNHQRQLSVILWTTVDNRLNILSLTAEYYVFIEYNLIQVD